MNGKGICEISGKLFLMYTFVQPPVNYTNIAKFKIHVKKKQKFKTSFTLGPFYERPIVQKTGAFVA